MLLVPDVSYNYMGRVYAFGDRNKGIHAPYITYKVSLHGQGICISCQISGMWMFLTLVPHTRYDYMGRVYVLAVTYQGHGCSLYTIQVMTTWAACMYWLSSISDVNALYIHYFYYYYHTYGLDGRPSCCTPRDHSSEGSL